MPLRDHLARDFPDLADAELAVLDDGDGLVATNCEISEKLILTEVSCHGSTTRIALDYSRMRILQGDYETEKWPAQSRLSLEGASFESFVFQKRIKGPKHDLIDEDLAIQRLRGPA